MVLAHYRQSHPQVFCVQVGAFDGMTDDPLYPLVEKHALRGVLVEPQKDAFARLSANYAKFGDRFRLVNAAIGSEDGTLPFYRIKDGAEGPDWLRLIASLDRSVLMTHKRLVPNLESLVVVDQVQAMTFSTLLDATQGVHVDLLVIDAEGYDGKILRMFDVGTRCPAIVRFEHKHLDRDDHEACLRELIGRGYQVAVSPDDTLAYRVS